MILVTQMFETYANQWISYKSSHDQDLYINFLSCQYNVNSVWKEYVEQMADIC